MSHAYVDFCNCSNGTRGENLMRIVMSAINLRTPLSMMITVLARIQTTNGPSQCGTHRMTTNSMRSDYNYIRNNDECIPIGPEPIEAGVCTGSPDQTYMGSSGYRLVPGNTCDQSRGVKKDAPISKKCSQGSCCLLCFVSESSRMGNALVIDGMWESHSRH